MEPKQIMTVVVSLIMLSVGVFAFFSVWTSLDESTDVATGGQECQAVADPSLQQTVNIGTDSATITRVTETLTDGTTQNIDAANYTYAGTTVTINVTG